MTSPDATQTRDDADLRRITELAEEMQSLADEWLHRHPENCECDRCDFTEARSAVLFAGLSAHRIAGEIGATV